MLNNNLFLINSPLEQFEVVSFIGINAPLLGNLNFTLTNLGLYSVLVLLLVTAFNNVGNKNKKLVPSNCSIVQKAHLQV